MTNPSNRKRSRFNVARLDLLRRKKEAGVKMNKKEKSDLKFMTNKTYSHK